MTKLWVASDLHLEHGGSWPVPPDDADVAVFAGDICRDNYLRLVAKDMPVIFVAGNHEYYNSVMPERRAALADIPGVHFLDNAPVIVAGVCFYGSTLWTDYAGGNRVVMDACNRALNDHRLIRANSSGELFDARAAYGVHMSSIFALNDFLADLAVRGHHGPLVVVTHHAPSLRSVHPRFGASEINPAFASDLEELVARSEATLWVHGHMHDPADYTIYRTRVICNPRGYPHEAGNGFNPNLIVEV